VTHGLKLAQPLAAAAAVCAGQGCGGLLGQRVGFMLLEDMQVAGPRNILLSLPPGFYEVTAASTCEGVVHAAQSRLVAFGCSLAVCLRPSGPTLYCVGKQASNC
jgi:hypothetical protein